MRWQRYHSASVCIAHYQSCHCLFIPFFSFWLHAAGWSVTSHPPVSASQESGAEGQIVQLSVKREGVVLSHVSNHHNDVLSCLQSFTFTKSYSLQFSHCLLHLFFCLSVHVCRYLSLSAVLSAFCSVLICIFTCQLFSVFFLSWQLSSAVCSHQSHHSSYVCSTHLILSYLVFSHLTHLTLSCQSVCLCLQSLHCLQFSHLVLSCLVCSAHLVSLLISVCSLHAVCSLHVLSYPVLSALLTSLYQCCCSLCVCLQFSYLLSSHSLILACQCCSPHLCLQSQCYVSHLVLLSSAWWCVAASVSVCSLCILSCLILLCSALLILSALLQSLYLSAVSASYLILSHLTQLTSAFQYCSLCICLQLLCLISLISSCSAQLILMLFSSHICLQFMPHLLSCSAYLILIMLQLLHLSAVSVSHHSCLVSLISSAHLDVVFSSVSVCSLHLISHLIWLTSPWWFAVSVSVCSLCVLSLVSCLTHLISLPASVCRTCTVCSLCIFSCLVWPHSAHLVSVAAAAPICSPCTLSSHCWHHSCCICLQPLHPQLSLSASQFLHLPAALMLSAVSEPHLVLSCLTLLTSSCQCCCSPHICLQSLCLVLSWLALLSSH